MLLLFLLCILLSIVVVALIIKIVTMQKSITEITEALWAHLSTDTNQLILLSGGDRYVRRLANELSKQLSLLRCQRRQYINGDRELKEAVTNISHDLRTPLTAICGYLDLLAQEEKNETTERYIGQIAGRVELLKSLTEELFRYSVISAAEDLHFEKTDVCRVLEDTLLSFYGAFAQKGFTPHIVMPAAPLWRNLDPSALGRIFGNIISNAVKYSDGDLSVYADENGKITFSNTSAELSKVDVGKLFDRFFTVDTAHKSTGLGLSIAKLLCEKMGGRMDADYSGGQLHITVRFGADPDETEHSRG